MQYIDNIIVSTIAPEIGNVLWVDCTNPKDIQYRVFLNGAWTTVQDENPKVGDLAQLQTSTKSNAVAAINEIVGKIGNLNNLSTTNKASIVNAINEVFNMALGIPKETTIPSGGMLPNVFYVLGTISTNTAFTLASSQHSNKYEEYLWEFTVSGTPQITFPNTIDWGDETPELEDGKTYQVSVVNNLGVIKSW